MDADLSHPPERFPALLAALEHADVAIGSRYVRGGGVRDWPWRRRAISWGGNVYVRLFLGIPVHDATAGFKAFRRAALEQIGAVALGVQRLLLPDREHVACQPARPADHRGADHVPRPHARRASKMSGDIVREAMLRVLTWRWREITHEVDHVVPAGSSTMSRPDAAAGEVHLAPRWSPS